MVCFEDKCLGEVRARFSIPQWFEFWNLTSSWCDFQERELRHPDVTLVTEQTSMTHRNGRCYQVKEYVVSEYVTTWRWGTCCARLSLKTGALSEAIRLAIEFLRATDAEVRDLMSPGPGDVVNLAATWGGLGKMIGAVLPSVGDAMSTVQLSEILDNLEPMRQRIRDMLDTINRLRPFDGQIVCRTEIEASEWQYHYSEFDPIFRTITEMIEIECDQSLLDRPEGLLIREDERGIYPAQPESGELGDLIGESGGLWDDEFTDRLMELIRRIREQGGADR